MSSLSRTVALGLLLGFMAESQAWFSRIDPEAQAASRALFSLCLHVGCGCWRAAPLRVGLVAARSDNAASRWRRNCLVQQKSASRQLWLTVPVGQNLTVLCQKARIEAAQTGVFAVDQYALHALVLSLSAAPDCLGSRPILKHWRGS